MPCILCFVEIKVVSVHSCHCLYIFIESFSSISSFVLYCDIWLISNYDYQFRKSYINLSFMSVETHIYIYTYRVYCYLLLTTSFLASIRTVLGGLENIFFQSACHSE